MPGPVNQANFLQECSGTFGAIGPGSAAGEHRHLHIFERGERWQEVERLEDEANLAGPVAVEVE